MVGLYFPLLEMLMRWVLSNGLKMVHGLYSASNSDPPNGDFGKQRSPALLFGYGDNPNAVDCFETGMKMR